MKATSRKTSSQSYRNDILKFAMEQYGTKPDYPWIGLPNYTVLRHSDNRKWYAIIMDVPKNKLGLSGTETVDIIDVKCDPILGGSLQCEKGILPAYHMHRGNWLTVLLDDSVEVDIPYNYDDGKVHMSRAMKLQLLMKYNKEPVGWNKLKEHGAFAVRGLRSMPSSLSNEIEAIYHE